MRTITILAASAAALPCVPAMAQVSASGTTRLRVETIDGQARAGFNESDTLLNLRTTLAAQYEEGPVKVVGELWDSRVSGDNAGTPLSTGEQSGRPHQGCRLHHKNGCPGSRRRLKR
jgi:hypothetical protein